MKDVVESKETVMRRREDEEAKNEISIMNWVDGVRWSPHQMKKLMFRTIAWAKGWRAKRQLFT